MVRSFYFPNYWPPTIKWDTCPRGARHGPGEPKTTVLFVVLMWGPSDQPARGEAGWAGAAPAPEPFDRLLF